MLCGIETGQACEIETQFYLRHQFVLDDIQRETERNDDELAEEDWI